MVGRLEKAGYVETKHYKGVKLSDEGLKHTLISLSVTACWSYF